VFAIFVKCPGFCEDDKFFAPSRSENRQGRQERQGSLDCAPIVLQARHADSGQKLARVSVLFFVPAGGLGELGGSSLLLESFHVSPVSPW
jgi:hypothetical protein